MRTIHTASFRAGLDQALANPAQSFYDTFAKHGLGDIAEQVLAGRSIKPLVFADGAAPAGMFHRTDAIEVVPGTQTTIDGQPLSDIWTELQMALEVFNAHASAYVAALSFRVTRPQNKIAVPHTPGFQEATEFGRPSKIKTHFVTRAFPLDHHDLGTGYTQEFIDDMTADQIMAVSALARRSWTELQQEVVLNALLRNTNYTDQDGLFVRSLYNGDGEIPPRVKRWEFDGTHTHYLADSTPAFEDLEEMSEHLIHHGFREFGGQDVTFALHVRREDLATIRDLDEFVPADSASQPVIIDGNRIGRTRAAMTPSGLNVEGYIGDWTLVQDNNLPEGYWVGIVENPPISREQNVVGLREHENPSARGLRLIEGNRAHYPIYESVYDGYLGAGVGQRGAAVVLYTESNSYAAPDLLGD